jgi:hypothetical protein
MATAFAAIRHPRNTPIIGRAPSQRKAHQAAESRRRKHAPIRSRLPLATIGVFVHVLNHSIDERHAADNPCFRLCDHFYPNLLTYCSVYRSRSARMKTGCLTT